MKPQTDDDLPPPVDRRTVNVTITTILNDLFPLKLTDAFCGFKAHRVSAMRRLRLDETGLRIPAATLAASGDAAKFRVTEIPVCG